MTDETNVHQFRPRIVGDGIKIEVDEILEAHKGEFVRMVLVGECEDGSIAIAGSDSAAESLMLLMFGQNFLVSNEVIRS